MKYETFNLLVDRSQCSVWSELHRAASFISESIRTACSLNLRPLLSFPAFTYSSESRRCLKGTKNPKKYHFMSPLLSQLWLSFQFCVCSSLTCPCEYYRSLFSLFSFLTTRASFKTVCKRSLCLLNFRLTARAISSVCNYLSRLVLLACWTSFLES